MRCMIEGEREWQRSGVIFELGRGEPCTDRIWEVTGLGISLAFKNPS